MQVNVRVQDGGDDLLRWLKADPVSAHTELSLPAAESEQESMGAAETVQAIVDSATGLTSLVIAVAAWRDARRHDPARNPPPVVHIQHGAASVQISADDPAAVARVVEALTAVDRSGTDEDSSAG
ncbi:effector-associated constant component EACC1 [Streptomyces sp. NPDC002073]